MLIMAVVLLCGLTQSQAGNSIWTNTAGGNWNTAANWHPNGVPATGNTVFITNSGNYTVTINSTASIADLVLGHTHATGTQRLALTGGTFAITNLTSASNSVISVTAGTLVTAGARNFSEKSTRRAAPGTCWRRAASTPTT